MKRTHIQPSAFFGRRRKLAWIVALGALGLLGSQAWHTRPRKTSVSSAPAIPKATYVGASHCRSCHSEQFDAWRGSHHELAMQEANDRSVLGDFSSARFTFAGVTSTFFRREGQWWVNTEGADAKLSDFKIRYTFGVNPLQQYLIEMPGGRLQALGIAWDARPLSEGGQRWFHLYPDAPPAAGQPLHWTGLDQNWNYQCADCHSTGVKKNYDAESKTYATSWSDINVSCEACHGAASNHLVWAKAQGERPNYPNQGLVQILDHRVAIKSAIDLKTGNASILRPGAASRELETCARCHSRRGQFSDEGTAGQPLGDGFRVALLEEGLYWSDGQQRDEVYEHGSFLQSKMGSKGVACSDCHEPHSLKLRADGNAVCSGCHLSTKYDGPQHTFHAAGASCVGCHMPSKRYMVIDERHDHSLRIPRPDRTVTLGSPNACNGCHGNRSPRWAADFVQRWYGHTPQGHQRFAETFAAAEQSAPGAHSQLRVLADDKNEPAWVRASAVSRLQGIGDSPTMLTLRRLLEDTDAGVRRSSVAALARADAETREAWLPSLLKDPVRNVRMEAARALAGSSEARLTPQDRPAFERALAEYIAGQTFLADRPESHLNMAMLHSERGEAAKAEQAFREALALDSTFLPGWVNLADFLRSQGREPDAEQVLRDGLRRFPGEAALHHALGLALVRQGRTKESLAALALAAQHAPNNIRYAYVYGVALHSAGDVVQAIATLAKAQRQAPGDLQLLQALAAFERDRGNTNAARAWVQRLREAAVR